MKTKKKVSKVTIVILIIAVLAVVVGGILYVNNKGQPSIVTPAIEFSQPLNCSYYQPHIVTLNSTSMGYKVSIMNNVTKKSILFSINSSTQDYSTNFDALNINVKKQQGDDFTIGIGDNVFYLSPALNYTNQVIHDYQVLDFICENIPDCPDKQQRNPLPRQMFCNLPDKNKDFSKYVTQYQLLRLGMDDMPYDVWIQPEFIPTWDTTIISFYKNIKLNRRGVPTLGISPAEWVFYPEKGQSYTIYTKVEMAQYVMYYLGVQPQVEWPNTGAMQYNKWSDGTSIITNPPNASKWFTVGFNKDEFLFTPTYPQYTLDYAQQMVLNITVSPDTPKGKYVFYVNFVAPPADIDKAYIKQYLNLYDNGQYLVKPYFRIFMEVD